MMNPKWLATSLALALFVVISLSPAAKAQTQSGNGQLKSKTGTWTVTSPTGVPQTSIFTPGQDSDFLLTAYVSISGSGQNSLDGICTLFTWTDPLAGVQQSEVPSAMSGAACAIDQGPGGTNGGTVVIHVKAHTSVYVQSLSWSNGAWNYPHTALVVVSKIRLD